jgi:tetratricopeptide (TPR) repeat protein
MGVVLQKPGRQGEALAAYDRAVLEDPGSASSWYNKGVVLEAIGRNEEALGAYDRVLSLDPCNEQALYNKGVTLEQLGRDTEAVHAYNRALDINAWDKEALFAKGTALEHLGKIQESLHCYDQSLSLDEKNVCAWVHKAEILEKEEKYFEASECYERALTIDPNLEEAQEGLSHLQPCISVSCKSLQMNPSGWITLELLLKNTGKAFAYDVNLSSHGCEEAKMPKTFVVASGQEKSVVVHVLPGAKCAESVDIYALYHNGMGKNYDNTLQIRLTTQDSGNHLPSR